MHVYILVYVGSRNWYIGICRNYRQRQLGFVREFCLDIILGFYPEDSAAAPIGACVELREPQ